MKKKPKLKKWKGGLRVPWSKYKGISEEDKAGFISLSKWKCYHQPPQWSPATIKRAQQICNELFWTNPVPLNGTYVIQHHIFRKGMHIAIKGIDFIITSVKSKRKYVLTLEKK